MKKDPNKVQQDLQEHKEHPSARIQLYRRKIVGREYVEIYDVLGCGDGQSVVLDLECGHTTTVPLSSLPPYTRKHVCIQCYRQQALRRKT